MQGVVIGATSYKNQTLEDIHKDIKKWIEFVNNSRIVACALFVHILNLFMYSF